MTRKKKRSAKQLANDKRLGAMAKARAKKRRKTTRVKTKRNPRVKTKRNPRKKSAKSHLWLIFKCKGSVVSFLRLGNLPGWTTDKGKAVLIKRKSDAANLARNLSKKRGMSTWYLGVAPDSMTSAQIAAKCRGKA